MITFNLNCITTTLVGEIAQRAFLSHRPPCSHRESLDVWNYTRCQNQVPLSGRIWRKLELTAISWILKSLAAGKGGPMWTNNGSPQWAARCAGWWRLSWTRGTGHYQCGSEKWHSTLGQKSWKCWVWERIQSSQIIHFSLENTPFLSVDAILHTSPVENCLQLCFVIMFLIDLKKRAHFEKLGKYTSSETIECWNLIVFTINQGKPHFLNSSSLKVWMNIVLFLWFSHPFS